MTNDPDEFITIRSRDVTPGAATKHADLSSTRNLSSRLTVAGLLVLLAIGAWIFIFLPDRIERPVIEAESGAAAVAASRSPAEHEPAPYEALQIDRERQRAQETLARFVLLQIKLEEKMHVAQWAADEFDAAMRLANEGDDLFTKSHFDDAMGLYEQGITALEQLDRAGESRFAEAIAAAAVAIDARDASAAQRAYADAALIYPDHAAIAAGRLRVQLLPEIIELLDNADRAVDRGDWRAALVQLRSIAKLDPQTNGLADALARATAKVADLDFQGLLSAGYAALDGADFKSARRAFNAALRQRPDDVAARNGLEQVNQRATLSRIDQLRQKATDSESAERWAEALALYNDVLGVDSSIKFAKDGRDRAQARLELESNLASAIADPGVLSADAAFSATALLYRSAVQVPDPGPRLTRQIDQLEKILSIAAQPVTVTLLSDAATEVTISQLGALGAFSRKDLRLRPGRYVLIGSRNGRRDVRQSLDVTPQMPPVEISCKDAI